MKSLFYSLLIVLTIFVVYSLMQAVGTGVSLKYEGEEAHVAINLNKRLSEQQRAEEHREVMKFEQSIQRKQTFYFGISAASFLGIVLVMYFRKSFV